MTRDEILKRMADGALYLERTDLTPRQREKGMLRYDELDKELQRIDKERKEEISRIDPKVLAEMNKIREILRMEKR